MLQCSRTNIPNSQNDGRRQAFFKQEKLEDAHFRRAFDGDKNSKGQRVKSHQKGEQYTMDPLAERVKELETNHEERLMECTQEKNA